MIKIKINIANPENITIRVFNQDFQEIPTLYGNGWTSIDAAIEEYTHYLEIECGYPITEIQITR